MKVAFGKIKITPKDVIGKPMAGYSRPDPCKGILDDIYAHGVLIEDIVLGDVKKKLLLISLDLLKIPLLVSDYIKEKIKDEVFSLGPGQILIHATHTHSAPDITGEFYWPGNVLNVIRGIMFGANRNDHYIIWMTMRIVKLVKKLVNNLKPCKIAWTKEKFNPDIVINRRNPLDKPMPDLGVISFKNMENDEIIGFIINYACHPTTLSYLNNKLSADYPGRVIHRINELTNGKINAVFFTGPAGDLNPITTCGTNYKKLVKNRTPIYKQMGTYKHTTKLGNIIAEEALKMVKKIPDKNYYNKLEYKSYLKTIWIPMKDARYFSKTWLQNKIIYLLKKYLVLPVAMMHEEDPNFPGLAIKKRGKNINGYTLLQYIILKAYNENGDSKKFSIITVPGELFHKIGNFLRKKSLTEPENTFIFQNSNDWIAYLFPLKDYMEQGGYEPIASFGPLCGHYVTEEFIKFYDEIKEKITFGHW